jgi:GT2 family glycosyltransferase
MSVTPDSLRPGLVDATIVIPQHGQAERTVACVRSLRLWEPHPWPVIVVDDGSPEKDRRMIRCALTDVTVIEQAHQGVTHAWNAATRWIDTPFTVFLNNDTLTGGRWVDALLAPLRSGSAVLSGAAWRDERALPTEIARRLPTTRFVEGWCCAVATAQVREIGLFDESLRLYFSDTDLQARLARAWGPDCLAVVGDVGEALRHCGHASTRLLPDRRRIWAEDRRRFIRKWSGE